MEGKKNPLFLGEDCRWAEQEQPRTELTGCGEVARNFLMDMFLQILILVWTGARRPRSDMMS